MSTPITVDAAREMADKFGKDVMVVVAWDWRTGTYCLVTVGSDALYTQVAVNMREEISKALKLTDRPGEPQEDKRDEHVVYIIRSLFDGAGVVHDDKHAWLNKEEAEKAAREAELKWKRLYGRCIEYEALPLKIMDAKLGRPDIRLTP